MIILPFNEGPSERATDVSFAQTKAVNTRRSELLKSLDEELQTNEECLKKNSILHRLPKESEKLTAKFNKKQIDPVFALVLTNLGFSLKDTGYEKWNTQRCADLYSAIFEIISSNNSLFSTPTELTDKVKNAIHQLQNPDYLTKTNEVGGLELAQKIANLKEGDSYSVYGGWRGLPFGHNMVYRFERNIGSPSFDIYIYNAQNGTESHAGGKITPWRKQCHPCKLLKGVPWEELFFCSPKEKLRPHVFSQLLRLMQIEVKKGSEDLVMDCFFHCQHRLVSSKELLRQNLFISVQRSGNCAVKSTNCLLLDLIENYASYKKISLDIRFFTILSAYKSFVQSASSLPSDEKKTRIFQLKESAANFLNVLNSNFLNKSVGLNQEQYKIACATILQLQQELKSLELKFNEEDLKNYPIGGIYNKSTQKDDTVKRNEFVAQKLKKLLKPSLRTENEKRLIIEPDLGKNCTWAELESVLTELQKLTNQLREKGRNQDYVFQVEFTLKNLSHLKAEAIDKNNFDRDAAQRLQKLLLDQQNRYNAAVEKLGDVTSPAVQNTAMEFVALCYCLAVRVDQPYNVLKNYGISTEFFFKCVREDRLFCCQDKELLQQRNRLEKFFRRKQDFLFDPRSPPRFNETFLEGTTREGKLYKDYIKASPEIEAQLQQIAKGYDKTPPITSCYAIYGALACYNKAHFAQAATLLSHIHHLRASLILAYEMCQDSQNQYKYKSEVYECVGWENFIEFQFCTDRFKWGWEDLNKPSYQAYKRDFSPNDELKEYVGHSQSAHDVTELKSENSLLVGKEGENSPHFPFYLSLPEPEVQTTLLLQACEERLEQLSEPKFRLTLLHMLMKNVEIDKKIISPFIRSLTDPLTIRKFERLIRLGIKSFVDLMPEGKPRLQEMLFLIRIYARALQSLSDIHPHFSPLKEAEDLVKKLLIFLKKSAENLKDDPAAEDLKKEIRLAEVGLYLGLPFSSMESDTQADFFLQMIRFKNDFQSLSSSSDPSFVRTCKKRYFSWCSSSKKFFSSSENYNKFANAILKKVIGNERALVWKFQDNWISAEEGDEAWKIDLNEPSLRNASGTISEVYRELLSTSPSFKRLFGNKRYLLKIFGAGTDNETIYFKSPIWGDIKILGRDEKAIIKRQIKDKWFTYIPHQSPFRDSLCLNDALVADHALWVDLENRNDIRFCDLKTGHEICHTISDGKIYHNKTGNTFYRFDVEREFISRTPKPTKLSRLEDSQRISGWAEPAGSTLSKQCNYLELSRFYNPEDNTTLSFKWDPANEVWVYGSNPVFHIDEETDILINCAVNCFLHLVNAENTKRKVLIPSGKIVSKGYSPQASIHFPLSSTDGVGTDGQKGVIRYFEYEITGSGKLIAQGLESRIYLSHLFAAQKRYAEAAALLKEISISENLSEHAINTLKEYLKSSEFCKDYSPNACALHLLAYYKAKKINPFFSLDTKLAVRLYEDLYDYCHGLNKIDDSLVMSSGLEMELLTFLQTEPCEDTLKVIEERKNFLQDGQYIRKVITVHPKISSMSKISLDPGYIWHTEAYIEERQTLQESLLQPLFEKAYTTLKNLIPDSCDSQAFLYDLVFNIKNNQVFFSSEQKSALYLAANFPKEVPILPSKTDPREAKVEWYKQIRRLYDKYNISQATQNQATFLRPQDTLSQYHETQPTLSTPPKNFIALERALLSEEGQDALFKQWQKRVLEECGPSKVQPAQKNSFIAKEGIISDPLYETAIEEHGEYYVKDCAIAYQKEQSKKVFKRSLNREDYEKLLAEMKFEANRAQRHEASLLKEMDALIKRKPTDAFLNYAKYHSIRIARNTKTPTLEAVLRAACQSNAIEALCKLNPYLSEEESRLLQSYCIELMVENTHWRHLERVYGPLQKWLDGGQTNATFFEQAQMAMIEERHYDPTQQFFPLLFEYFSNMRVREKQAVIINDVLTKILRSDNTALQSRAFQLIMAGGKTNVIISILVELISESGSVPCILCHHSQFASAQGSFLAFQQKRFGKDLYILDHPIKDLSNLKILEHIYQRLKEAKLKKCPVLMKATFPQILELKFILESLRLSNTPKSKTEDYEKQLNCVEKLREINLFLRKQCVAFYDECDINLSILTDVNIPQGVAKNIQAERASIVQAIYDCFLDEKIKEMINLEKNLQAEVSSKDLAKKILPFIAEQLFSHPALLLGETDFKQAFIRYVTNKISPDDQAQADLLARDDKIDISEYSKISQENIRFLAELEKRYRFSDDRYEKDSCQLIALVRQMTCKVLKVAFSRSCNRNYGRDPDHEDGRVIPFLAVSSPATTKFGNVYLSLAYQFQTALNTPVLKGEVAFLAAEMFEAAEFYAQKDKVPFLETPEAKQFEELTQVNLIEIMRGEEALKRACEYINDPDHLERRLRFEAEVAPFHVRFFSKKASSNPINNVGQFKQSVACAGTLWNHSTYHRALTAKMDEGTEGLILNLMAEREKSYEEHGLTYIHEVKNLRIEDFLDLMRSHPNKKKLRSLIDGGGLLRDYSNEQLARALKNFITEEKEKGGPEVEAIVYLHKFSAEEIEKGFPKESFVLLKIEEEGFNPIPLKNTTEEEIKKHDLAMQDIFVLFDELRATGTDVVLADDAIFLSTVDHKMPIRTALQSALRARKVFFEQRVELVTLAKGRQEMVNEGKNFADLRKTWEINEAIMLKNQKDRARPAQIENLARSALIEDLLEKGPKNSEFVPSILNYEQFLLTPYNDDLYLQEKICANEKALKVLNRYAERIKSSYAKHLKNKELIDNIDMQLASFTKEVSADEVMTSTAFGDNTETEIQLEQEQVFDLELLDIDQEMARELQQELKQEWQSYNFNDVPVAAKEHPWNLKPERPLYPQMEKMLFAVRSTLSRTDYKRCKIPAKVKEYAEGFPDNLQMTHNFYHTSVEELPLLHRYTKESHFILVVADSNKKTQFILLSEKDAGFFKEWLNENSHVEAFLIDSRGLPETNTKKFDSQPQEFRDKVLEAMCYVNLFNGNNVFLDEHSEFAKELFKKHQNALGQYMLLKVYSSRGDDALKQLTSNKVFKYSRSQLPPQYHKGIVFSSRRKLIHKKYMEIRRFPAPLVAQMEPEDVSEIAPHQVKWLTTQEQVSYLLEERINDLSPDQIQKKLLSSDKFSLLRKKELIEEIKDAEDLLKLEKRQFTLLSEPQISLLKKTIREMYESKGVEAIEEKHLKLLVLNTGEIEALPCPTIGKIKAGLWPLISKLKLKQIQREASEIIDKKRVQKLSTSQLKVLDARYKDHLSDLQIQQLTEKHTHLIQALSSNDKLSLLNDQAVQKIQLSQLDFIEKEVFQKLSNLDLLLNAPKRCFDFFSDPQKEQLKATVKSEADVDHLSEPVFQVFLALCPDHVWPLISNPRLIEMQNSDGLGEKEVQRLTNTQLKVLAARYKDHLSDLQIQRLTEEHTHLIQAFSSNDKLSLLNNQAVQKIQHSQLDFIEKEVFQKLTNLDLLLNAPKRCFDFFSNPQKEQLKATVKSENDVDNLSEPVFQVFLALCPDHVWPLISNPKLIEMQNSDSLGEKEVQRLTNTQLKVLEARYKDLLSDLQIQRLTEEHTHLIQALSSNDKLSLLNDQAVQKIQHSQLDFIEKEVFQKLTNLHPLLNAPKRCFDFFSDPQKEQLKATVKSEDDVDHLSEPVFQVFLALCPDHVWPLISNPKLIGMQKSDSLGEKEVQRLSNTQLKVLEARYKDLLSDLQIQQLTEEHTQLIQALSSNDKLSLLNDQAVQKIQHSQLDFIEKEVFQKLTNLDLLLNAPKRCFGFFSDPQKEQLKATVKSEADVDRLSEPVFQVFLALCPDYVWPLISNKKLLEMQKSDSLGEKEVPRLSNTQLKVLEARYKDLLSDLQIQQLTEEHTHLIQALSSNDKLSLLNNQAVQKIQHSQLDFIEKEVFQKLTNLDLLLNAPKRCFDFFSDPQKEQLKAAVKSEDDVDHLSEPVFQVFLAVCPDHVWPLISNPKLLEMQKSDSLGEKEVQRLGNTQLKVLDARYKDHLSDLQIQQLTEEHTHLIHAFPSNNKLSLLNDQAVQKIQLSQLDFIEKEVFQKLTNLDLLLNAPKRCFDFFSDPQKEQLKATVKSEDDVDNLSESVFQVFLALCPDHVWPLISNKKLLVMQKSDSLDEKEVPRLSNSQLKVLDSRYSEHLSDLQIQQLTEEHTHLIHAFPSNNKLSLLNNQAVQKIQLPQLDFIEKEVFQKLTNLDLLLNAPKRCFDFFSDPQKEQLKATVKSEADVDNLSEPVFQVFLAVCPDYVWPLISNKKLLEMQKSDSLGEKEVPRLSTTQLKVLEARYKDHLSDLQIQQLTEEHTHLIQALSSNDKLAHLNEQAVQKIQHSQLDFIEKEVFQKLTNLDLLLNAPKRCFDFFSNPQKEQLKTMVKSEDDVDHLSEPVFQVFLAVCPDYVWPLISNKKLLEMQKSDSLGEKEVPRLSNSQLKVLEARYKDHLSDLQIQQLMEEHTHLIQALSSNGKLSLLNEQASQKIQLSQLDFIEKEVFQKLTNLDLLLNAPKRCFDFFSNPQKEQLKATVKSEDDVDNLSEPVFQVFLAVCPDYVWPLISNKKLLEMQKSDSLGEKEVPRLSNSQLKVLEARYAEYLSDLQIQQLTEEHTHLIQALSSNNKLSLLNDEALQKIKETQLEIIEKENFQKLTHLDLLLSTPERCILFFSDAQRKQLDAAIIDEAHAEKLNEPMFRLLWDSHPDLVKKLKEPQVKWLVEEKEFSQLEDQQLNWLTDEQVGMIRSPEMAARLNAHAPDRSRLYKQLEAQRKEALIAKYIKITTIVLCVLALLVAIAALVVGCFALSGAKLAFGPQFLIRAFEAIQSSSFAPYILIVGGGMIKVGLVGFAIDRCLQHRLKGQAQV